MRIIQTEITMEASSWTVWDHLADLGAYSSWNPLVQGTSGRVKEGKMLNPVFTLNGSKPRRCRVTIDEVAQRRELHWSGYYLNPKIFRFKEIFRIQSLDDKLVVLKHVAKFNGFFAAVSWNQLDAAITKAFEEFNGKLKAISERTENR